MSETTAEKPTPQKDGFDNTIAPLLARRCLECHNATEKKGGLDLTRRANTLTGGESGAALVAGKPDESLLWQRVQDDEMPPKHPLPAEEKIILRNWIAGGAVWGTDPVDPYRYSSKGRAGYDWWSLKPLQRPSPPFVDGQPLRNPIDAFVLARLKEKGLSPSPPSDRRTLIRRLYFDLLGLPPGEQEVERFVQDKSPDAYQRLVDRLLASPHYGQRWARHWLDVARYGESQGFERDKLRPHSWHWRDWVVDAFNSDMPYDQFARLQLAGDVLRPDDAGAISATGFLVAGPYDEVGQNQQSAAMRAVVRQDELEDIVGTVGQTFLGLTVHCARCHGHKFDPVRQSEYYRLAAALSGVRHGNRKIFTPAMQGEINSLKARRSRIQQQLTALEKKIEAKVLSNRKDRKDKPAPPRPLARWNFDGDLRDSLGTLHGQAHGGARIADGRLVLDGRGGYVSTAPLPKPLAAKTLEVWLRLGNLQQRGGGAISVQTTDGHTFDAVVFGEREPGRWMAGSNFFRRTKSFGGPPEKEADKRIVHLAIVYELDGRITAYQNGRPYGQAYRSVGLQKYPAQKTQVLFGLRHGTSAGSNRMLAAEIDRAQLYDRALSASEIAASAGRNDFVTPEQLASAMTTPERKQYATWRIELDTIDARLGKIQQIETYAVVPRQPQTAHVLLRGNPAAKGPVVAAGGIAALGESAAEFGLSPDAPESKRRSALAGWIATVKNPLFARVMANRLWHYHFGSGIVDTPNDFGFNGGRPSHPLLLDYLASYLIDSGWSLKALHRLIVTSDTYRQRSRRRVDCAQIDAGNRLLWRMSPRRLEAETLRDSLLAVSGQLNRQIGGAPYQDFKTFNFNSQFYQPIDPVGFQFNRRTIYRTWLRSGRNRFLDAFDCPDPSTTAPRRAVTNTPTQSLALLNNSFVLRMANKLAEAAKREAGDDSRKQIDRVYQCAFQRDASDDEIELSLPFVKQHGLAAFCRVIVNSNEFLFID